MIIKISDEINNALDFNESATEFIEKLNDMDDNEFIIDFEGVFFVSRTFAQAYYASKKRSNKSISEINFSNEVEPLMLMVEKQIIGE